MLIDSHCHLLDERLNAEEEIARMKEDGLLAVVENGFDLDSSRRASELAQRHEGVYCAVGCHPEEAGGYKAEDEEEYLALCALPKTVAVGEIGLDYYYEIAPRDLQRKVFIAQLIWAHKAKKPVNLHIRDAYGEAYDILKEHRELLTDGFLLHCYGGSAEMAERFAEMGAYFAFGGVITFKNAKKEDVLKSVPKDRLLFETDCPYMTPEPFRGRVNRPAYVKYVAKKAAEILGMSEEEAGRLSVENTLRYYRIAK